MAIKGKRRPRGTRRGIAAAPRPHLVIPSKPFFRRRGVQITLVVVLIALVAGLVWWGLARRRSARQLAAEREDASSFSTFVEEVLRRRAVGQPILTTYRILPDLEAAVGQLKAGQGDEKRLVEQAGTWSAAAASAAEDISALQPDLPELRETRNLMRRSLELYAGVADALAVAAQLDGKPRKDLLASIEKQLTTASKVWGLSWIKLTTVKSRLDILPPAPFPGPLQPGQIPGVP
ncbi:MAG TPA: hypothetical protein VGS09_06935 [Actinomycetota bacterium]|jgi:hypothetical protein|nr:hypothetical protein [Actinomycetota bacterium]